jgi:hypothetical protein
MSTGIWIAIEDYEGLFTAKNDQVFKVIRLSLYFTKNTTFLAFVVFKIGHAPG